MIKCNLQRGKLSIATYIAVLRQVLVLTAAPRSSREGWKRAVTSRLWSPWRSGAGWTQSSGTYPPLPRPAENRNTTTWSHPPLAARSLLTTTRLLADRSLPTRQPYSTTWTCWQHCRPTYCTGRVWLAALLFCRPTCTGVQHCRRVTLL